MPFPSDSDPDLVVENLINDEFDRQISGLQLIASENFTSPAVMRAVGSVLTNKYSEGYPGKRYYGGNQVVDSIEALAIERVKALFGADHANVQPHSGASANMAVYLGLVKPGDTILGLSLDHGGHLTHGSPVNASGILYNFVSYKVSSGDERIDMEEVRALALQHRPKLIVAGTTSYTRRLEPEPFKQDNKAVAGRPGGKVLLPPQIQTKGYQFIIKLLRAEALVKMDLTGGTDLYIIIEFGSARYKTKTKKSTLEPVWGYEVYV